ncbi:hypothetical protein Tco_1038986 [Tanacetum coccineum]
MDDEPMWAADRVVAPTPSSVITIPETANEFAIKDVFKYRDTENEVLYLMMFPLSLTGEAKTWLDELNEGTIEIFADKQSSRPSGSFPSNTQPNPKGSSSKPYQPPQARNEHDKDDESTPQPKNPKPVKENLTPKPYKPKIPYPQCLRKEKMEAQYGKFLDMIRAIRINVPLVNVLTRMPNYGKFLKELVSNKHKLEQISAAFLSGESSALIQNSTKLSHVML